MIAIGVVISLVVGFLIGNAVGSSDTSAAPVDIQPNVQTIPTPDPTTAAPPAVEPTPTPTPDAGTDPGVDAAYTAPGTVVGLGEPMILPMSSGHEDGPIQLTLTSIEQGTAADLVDLDLGEQGAGMVPYFMHFTVTAVEGSAVLAYGLTTQYIRGILPDGQTTSALMVFGAWDRCSNTSIPGDFAPGQSFETCRPFLVNEATSIVGAEFAMFDTPYDSYSGDPVRWQ